MVLGRTVTIYSIYHSWINYMFLLMFRFPSRNKSSILTAMLIPLMIHCTVDKEPYEHLARMWGWRVGKRIQRPQKEFFLVAM